MKTKSQKKIFKRKQKLTFDIYSIKEIKCGRQG